MNIYGKDIQAWDIYFAFLLTEPQKNRGNMCVNCNRSKIKGTIKFTLEFTTRICFVNILQIYK